MPFVASDAETDDALLARYARGDAAAARALTARLAPKAFSHALRVLGDRMEAEDVAQDAMMRLWMIAPKWRAGEAKVSTWLYRVTANLCTDHLRRRGRAGPALDDIPEPEDPMPGADARLLAASRAEAVTAALRGLPDRQRQSIVLRHFEGLANPEIAEVLGISVEAVESLTARAKRALAAALGPMKDALGYEDG
mgnify:FL=1